MPTQENHTKFHPEDFGFKKLDLQNGSLFFYEYAVGEFCDGKVNPHRINVYLTTDNDFVTVWHGLFDPALVDRKFHELIEQAGLEDFDFHTQYTTELLRGYIESAEEARVILKSLRYEKYVPNMLVIDTLNKIACVSI